MTIRQFSQRFSHRFLPAAPRPDAHDHESANWRRVVFDRWFAGPPNPIISHQAVLQLTYGIIPGVVLMALVTYLLGITLPLWLIAAQGAVLLSATWEQERLLARGIYRKWMPAAHLNLAVLMLSVWVAFSGGIVSPFVWTYAVGIAIHGIFWGTGWGVATAALCTAYLLAVLALMPLVGRTSVIPAPAPGVTEVFVISYVGMFFAVAALSGALRRQARDVLHLAHTDALTGLANRRALGRALDRELARAARYGHPCSVLVLELDRFKTVNDRFGHLAGDEALRQVASILTGSCRATDVLARFGGDEFVVVMPHTAGAEALHVGERLCRDVEEFTLLRGVQVTLSAGVAECPANGETSRELLDAADQAMYGVKRSGGNGIARAETAASPAVG